MKIILNLFFIGIFGCAPFLNKDIENIYTHREKVLSDFSKISVFRTRMGQSILLYTYSNNLKNEYVFTQTNNKYSLVRDSVSFMPDIILGVNKYTINKKTYEGMLEEKLQYFVQSMNSLNISDVTSEFIEQGVDMKIYLHSGSTVIFVSSIDGINNSEWRKYIMSIKKIDENWYYSTDTK